MKKTSKTGLLIITLAGLMAVGYYSYRHFYVKPVQAYPIEKVPVETIAVQQYAMPQTIQALGELQAFQQVDLSPQNDGHIQEILFQDGQQIKKGQILVLMNSDEVKAQLKAQSSALALAKIQYERLLQLNKHLAVSKNELDVAKNTYLQAQAQVDQAEVALKYTILRAPFDGYIGAHVVDRGQFIKAGTTIATLVNVQPLKVNYQVSADYLPNLQIGQKIYATVSAYPNARFEGKVSFISPYIDSTTRTVQVQAMIPNVDRKLAPGMFAEIEQMIVEQRKALVLPIAALVPSIDGTIVYKIVNNRAVLTRVKTGVSWDKYVEITAGVNLGDIVAMTGQQRLRDGLEVNIVPNTWPDLSK